MSSTEEVKDINGGAGQPPVDEQKVAEQPPQQVSQEPAATDKPPLVEGEQQAGSAANQQAPGSSEQKPPPGEGEQKPVGEENKEAGQPGQAGEQQEQQAAQNQPLPEEVGEQDLEEVEEDVEEDIPAEELEQLKQKAKEQGQNEEDVPKKRIVKKKVKRPKQQQQQPSSGDDQQQRPSSQQAKQDKSRQVHDNCKQMQNTNFQINQIKVKPLIQWTKDVLEREMTIFDINLWLESHDQALTSFFQDQSVVKIFFWVTEAGLQFTFSEPPLLNEHSYDQDFEFFTKVQPPNATEDQNQVAINMENVDVIVKHNAVKPNYLQTLLKLLDEQYNPQIYADNSWPENVKKEFIAQLHKFMAQLTEASQQNEGFTKLYIPKEDISDFSASSQDKDLIQRLETTLIQWYRQIKEVVNNQDNQHDNENAGPLDEITYWRKRKENLSFIQTQLENPELKKIIKILKDVDSSYVLSFEELIKNINRKSEEAEDNLSFLNSLYDPCRKLEESQPNQIPDILPSLLNRVRMIWEHSKHYNSNERIAGLLHKISNEIIKRCKAIINVEDLLGRDVEKCTRDLQDSIECGKQWKRIYEKTVALINKRNKTGGKWDFNLNSIFAQIDAFVQRCSELTEICEGQLQFAGKGNKIPQFGGSHGPEIENILEEIKDSFRKHLDKIRNSKAETILDVKAPNWHDLFNTFKTGLKDLDVMYQNIINFAFEQVATVQQGVEMLEAFDYLAKRDSIKQAVKKKAVELLQMFSDELDKTKYEYDNLKKSFVSQLMNIPLQHGKYSGQAIWVRSLIHRIQNMKDWIDKLYFVEEEIKRAAFDKYDNIFQSLRLFIVTTKLKEWKEENKELEESPSQLTKSLEIPLLARRVEEGGGSGGHGQQQQPANQALTQGAKAGHIESNFDRPLERLMHEVVAWKKLIPFGIVVPNYADDFTTVNRENLRVLKELVMLVVRDHNKIIDYMDESEKKLFRGHLDQMDRQIHPGLARLKWSSKGILENFARDSRRSCNELFNKLKVFKQNTEKIDQKCQDIANQLLIKIDRKKAIEIKAFEEEQERHRREKYNKLKGGFEEIKKILSETYETFIGQGPEIQKQWFEYVDKRDQKIEDALKKAVKNSLLELHKIVGDDDKMQAQPIFKLSVEIENNQLCFKPSTDYLIQMMRSTMASMLEILKNFRRMSVEMQEERKRKLDEMRILKEKEAKANPLLAQQQQRRAGEPQQPAITVEEPLRAKDDYFEQISADHDVKKYTSKILENLKKWCDDLEKGDLTDPWKQKMTYWQNCLTPGYKEKMAEGMMKPGDDISNIRSFIEKFEGDSQEIQREKTTDKHGCITLDNTNVKQSIVEILLKYQQAFLNSVQKKAISELNQLYEYFQTNEVYLGPAPMDLHQLKKNMDILNSCKAEKPSTEKKLKPIEDKFKLLEDYSIQLNEADMQRKNALKEAWTQFCLMLDEKEGRNLRVYQELYNETNKNLEEFMKEGAECKIVFSANAPYQVGNLANEKAFQILNEYKEQVKQLRKKEVTMKFGFDLFSINYSPSAELESVEREISNLEDVWRTKDRWDKQWEDVKAIRFKDFSLETLDDMAEEYQVKLNAYPKEMKKWEIVNAVKTTVEQFRQTLPFIKMLREKYMRSRHWDKLQKLLNNAVLDYESDTFILHDIFKINILASAESVREVCETAAQEYKIESALAAIESKWEVLELIMEEHKKGFYKVKKIDEIQSALEDHMGVLSAQKTSLFFDSFREQIEMWENRLQLILETLEQLLQVQKQWIYLESIFASQQNEQDKQLMGDIAKFLKIEKTFQKYMCDIYADRNVKRSIGREGFLRELQDMSKLLEESQKKLLQLLERNRKEFPRFYFLSNDDLFEILGNSKDPSRVNKHIKKCFEGIKRLEFAPSSTAGSAAISGKGGKGSQEVFEVVTLVSPEGETVPLKTKVPCLYGIEKWLKEVEIKMVENLKNLIQQCHNPQSSTGMQKKSDNKRLSWVQTWVNKHQGQLLIVASQINWTLDCQTALRQAAEKAEKHKVWKPVKDEKTHFINELTKLVRKPTQEVDRLKLIALITIEVHAKDIIDFLSKTCFSDQSFDWKKQLRFTYVPQNDYYDVFVEQTNTKFPYGFEYQGNNGRLVITALTDRCYMTLTTAMRLNKGGAPQGPAGTGKTETVKDLGKGMAKFVLVFNCSEGLDYKSIGRMFSGLVQTGGWGCFDEFNRIEVEVLSVVAQQMLSIMNALRALVANPDGPRTFAFEEDTIPINEQCAIFITMNPGYAGRSELPDNLKSLFRPISMMVPETSMICEIMLQSEGFKNGRPLSVKIVTLYTLMTQQLSKQDHYDFGLRAIKSVLNCAGAIRREKGAELMLSAAAASKDKEKDKEAEMEENQQETVILMRAIRDMNLPKLVQEDIFLFNNLFNDLFPNTELPEGNSNTSLSDQVEAELKALQLVPKPAMITKCMQLFDSKNTRHGNMLVGQALSGKSTVWKVLQKALNALNKTDPQHYAAVRLEILNPKSVNLNELFGWVDHQTLEWNEGVLSSMMSRLCKDESLDQRWMILDGPVDTLWIESMNTVLDDNKVLTLLNGDRISLPTQVGLVFEVEDLAVASPATVSRAGMIYIDANDLGWRPFIEGWIMRVKDPAVQEVLLDLVEKWLGKLFRARSMQCKELVKCLDINIVQSLTRLMDAFFRTEKAISLDIPEKNEIYWALLEKWWCFALIWSFGATVNEDGRKVIDYFMRDIESMFPHSNTVYDYYINIEKNEWSSWEDKINATVWKPNPNMPYHKMLVPTIDSARNRYILQALINNRIQTLVVGNTGTGKTAVINGILQDFDDTMTSMNIVFSSQTTSLKTQEQIESRLVRRSKNKMVTDGKRLVIFIDDLNMPRKDKFGSQPPLELVRQWIDYEGWYDRTTRDLFKAIIDIQFIAAMGPPGGGRAEISRRVQSKYNMINFTFPHDTQVRRIYQSILTYKFQEFDEEIKPLSEPIALATLNLFKAVSDTFLPTPAKSHYVFNMRDISKVIQGVYLLDRFYCDSKLTIFRMWVHESLRVFHDRLVSFDDRIQLKKLISDQLEQTLQTNMRDCSNEEEEDTIFVDFMEDSGGKQIYTEVPYKDRSLLKKFVDQKLAEYNEKMRGQTMDIVLFNEAISYVCRIHRIIKLGKGHGMLVGEGGSGRHSLTRLAAFIAGYELWMIEITKNYRMKEFRDDIKKWAESAGYKNRSGVFLFSDNQIINEGFIEDINNILSVGEVPNLFSQKEDYPNIREGIKKEYFKANNLEKDARMPPDEDLLDFFFTRIQNNFHLMLCMSKTGDTLRNYCRMYPGLVNNTTIVWYLPWPENALLEVANKYLSTLNLEAKVNIDEIPQSEGQGQEAPPEQQAAVQTQPQSQPQQQPQQPAGQNPQQQTPSQGQTAPASQQQAPASGEGNAAQQQQQATAEGQISQDELRSNIAVFFSSAHQKVLDLSDRMYRELKRVYYITPSNYIELVKGYCQLLRDKQDEFGGEIRKLALGLRKLLEAAQKSDELKQQLQRNSYVLSKKSKECEDLMIRIESESRDANEKQKEVDIRRGQVEKEKAEIKMIQQDAEQDLQAALPALQKAETDLQCLNSQKLAEMKAYKKPPQGVDNVMYAIMIIMGKDPTWATVQKELAQPDFLKKMQEIDKDHISQKTLLKIEKLTHDSTMSKERIKNISDVAASIWGFVLAMESYAKAFKDIEPKRAKVNLLREKLRKSEEELMTLEESFKKLQETIKDLNDKLKKAQEDMESYKEETKVLQEKQDRAEKLITGLEGTKEGWAVRRQGLEIKYDYLIGDTLMSAAFMSYAGPFPSEYRRIFVKDALLNMVKSLKIAHSKDYTFAEFLAKPIDFLNWTFQGLPDDDFSKENAVLVTKTQRFPLCIDPQLQANTWIKNMERSKVPSKEKVSEKVLVIDPQTENYMQTLERAISWGHVVILQNIDEDLDPSLEPILNKSLKKMAGKILLCISADKEIKYDPNFRFYMTTKLANPRYKAEVSTRVTLVNCTVKEEGLKEQLISVVIQKMEFQLEKQKNELVRKKADNEQKLKDLDEKILRMLQESKGSLIDDLDLIKALQAAKETEEEVRHQMETSTQQMRKTLNARNSYTSLAATASRLFFIINDFSLIDNMYQFSLESYIQLFARTIENYMAKQAVNDSLPEKLQNISERHKQEVYRYACRGLFEQDKLLLSIMMAVRLNTDIDADEWNFFLKGADLTADRKNQPPNPNPDWIQQASWDVVCDLDKMANFTGIIGAFTHNAKEWKRWYMSSTPETEALPGEWDQKCDHLRKMIIIKTIRSDRVLFMATQFVENKLSKEYTQPLPFNLETIFQDSSKITPVIFILSPGTDPFGQLDQFAKAKSTLLVPVSLGQGQAKKAREKVNEASRNGFWLYLANCHLSLSFLKELEKIIQSLEQMKADIHDNFRLWMSSMPHPKFPISILQKCVKVTSEPPKGVRANMLRLYQNMTIDKFISAKVTNKSYYKKLLFSLTWFHAIVIERKRFKNLGWNVVYDFNDSDWETADNILQMYVDDSAPIDKTLNPGQTGMSTGAPGAQGGTGAGDNLPPQKEPPWDAIRFLISEVTYGGRVTDDWDRRLLNVYANEFYSRNVLFEDKHKLGAFEQPYVIPDELTQKEAKNLDKTFAGSEPLYYASKIKEYPAVERPETFGQHINAEISSQIILTNNLVNSIISLSPRQGTGNEVSRESKVAIIIKELLEKLPEVINAEEVAEKINPQDESNPLKVVLMQEISRYNRVLTFVRNSLQSLDKGIQGFVLISEDLEKVMDSLFDGKVPESWKFAYYSLKPLNSWIEDLCKRIEQLNNWAYKGQPNVFWISGFTFPTGFTTALQQLSARKLRMPIDQFQWDFAFLPPDTNCSVPAKEGAYVEGLFLEGAKWDGDKNYIIDADPMKLHYKMPIIQFKPVYTEGKQKQKKGQSNYQCPCYYYPIRTGVRERPSYMLTVALPIKPNPSSVGTADQDYWVKRGTALLLTLGD